MAYIVGLSTVTVSTPALNRLGDNYANAANMCSQVTRLLTLYERGHSYLAKPLFSCISNGNKQEYVTEIFGIALVAVSSSFSGVMSLFRTVVRGVETYVSTEESAWFSERRVLSHSTMQGVRLLSPARLAIVHEQRTETLL